MSKQFRGSRGENQDYIRKLKATNRSLERENGRYKKLIARLEEALLKKEEDGEETTGKQMVTIEPTPNPPMKCPKCGGTDVKIMTFDLLVGPKSYRICKECGTTPLKTKK